MKRTWTIIGVSDVPSSCKWYGSLFGQAETRPGHVHFAQILDSDGTLSSLELMGHESSARQSQADFDRDA